MDIGLSPFRPERAAEISSWAESAEEAAAWAGATATFPVTADQFRTWQEDPDVYAFVGKHDDVLVAYGELWVDREEQEIELARILVHPEHRGKGIGRAFVRALVDRADDFAMEHFSLIVRVVPDNLAAIRCYQEAGFTELSADNQREFNQGQPREYRWLEK